MSNAEVVRNIFLYDFDVIKHETSTLDDHKYVYVSMINNLAIVILCMSIYVHVLVHVCVHVCVMNSCPKNKHNIW